MIGLDNEERGEAVIDTDADGCIHVTPNAPDLPDLALEHSGTWRTDFAWFTARMPQAGCVLCALGCCLQRVSGDIDMPPGKSIVLHGVLGAA